MKAMRQFAMCAIMMIVTSGLLAQFQEVTIPIPGIVNGSLDWSDYDNDGDMDLLVTGQDPTSLYLTRIYRNDGNDTFVDISAGLVGVDSSSSDWGDYDNDGDLDFVISGFSQTPGGVFTKVFKNEGNGVFNDINAGLPNVRVKVNWGDYDNDGFLDILLTGISGYNNTKLFRNNRNSTFSEISFGIPGYHPGSAEWGDYDNDGDLDILISGSVTVGSNSFLKTDIYRNDGGTSFVPLQTTFVGIQDGASLWADIDNDGQLDILVSGSSISKVYKNVGNGEFVDMEAGITGMINTSACWGDYNNDGFLDLFITGHSGVTETILYHNLGGTGFFDTDIPFVAAYFNDTGWGDYNNDGDLDILYAGLTDDSNRITKLFKNTTATPNTPPSIPANLHINIDDEYLFFHWDPAVDSQTASPGLSYSLRIGTTPDNCDLLSPMASQAGYRLKPARGMANSNFWKIKRSALPDVFYWNVQAIDTSFQGSTFALVQQVSFLPMISLLTPSSVNFGEVPVDGTSEWIEVTVRNTSYTGLSISAVSFYNSDTQFELNYPSAGTPVEAGDTASLFVRYEPSSVSAYGDTLFIHSDAENEPIIKIRLSGTGIHVPPNAPENPLIVMDGSNAVISWGAVTQTIFDTPVTPDYYLVFNSTDPYGNFTYYGATSGLTLTHSLVGLFSPFMFYRIIAVKFYDREGTDLSALGLVPGMTEEDVYKILHNFNKGGFHE